MADIIENTINSNTSNPNYEQPLNAGSDNVGVIGYSMKLSGMPDFMRKLKNKNPMEKLRELYGIPEIYADSYTEYLKYRIDPKYYELLNNHFKSFFASVGKSFPDRDYGKDQERYNLEHPEGGAGLDFSIPYEQFLEENMKRNGIKTPIVENEEVKQNKTMTDFMNTVMQQIKEIKENQSLILNNSNNVKQPDQTTNQINSNAITSGDGCNKQSKPAADSISSSQPTEIGGGQVTNGGGENSGGGQDMISGGSSQDLPRNEQS